MMDILGGYYLTAWLHAFFVASGATLGCASICKIMQWSPVNIVVNVKEKL